MNTNNTNELIEYSRYCTSEGASKWFEKINELTEIAEKSLDDFIDKIELLKATRESLKAKQELIYYNFAGEIMKMVHEGSSFDDIKIYIGTDKFDKRMVERIVKILLSYSNNGIEIVENVFDSLYFNTATGNALLQAYISSNEKTLN